MSTAIVQPVEGDYCLKCGRLLELVDEPEDGEPGHEPVILIQGEAVACCADYDNDGHHRNALCFDCCVPHGHAPSGGSGYYITSPR